MTKQFIYIIVIIALSTVDLIDSYGEVTFKLLKYQNLSTRTSNGKCCKRRKCGPCNNIIHICLSSASKSSSCIFADKTLNPLTEDDINFKYVNIGEGVGKPLVKTFENPLEQFFVKVAVNNDLEDNPDLVAIFKTTININISKDESISNIKNIILTSGESATVKRLEFSLRVNCNKDYIAPDCFDKKCSPRNDNLGHYECSNTTTKVCLPGWVDVESNCTKRELNSSKMVNVPFSTRMIHNFSSSSSKMICSSLKIIGSSRISRRNLSPVTELISKPFSSSKIIPSSTISKRNSSLVTDLLTKSLRNKKIHSFSTSNRSKLEKSHSTIYSSKKTIKINAISHSGKPYKTSAESYRQTSSIMYIETQKVKNDTDILKKNVGISHSKNLSKVISTSFKPTSMIMCTGIQKVNNDTNIRTKNVVRHSKKVLKKIAAVWAQ